MAKKVTRKINGVPEIVSVSDRRADELIARGWQLWVEPAPEPKPRKTLKVKAETDGLD